MAKYFIGIGLPEKEEKLIGFTKQQFPEGRVTTTPPHITLIEPFYIKEENKLINDLENWAKNQKTFIINIKEVDSFKQLEYGTIFLAPMEKEELNNLQKGLLEELDYLPDRKDFIPHLTIANGVGFDKMESAIERLKQMGIELNLTVDRVILFKMEKGNWYQNKLIWWSGSAG